MKGLNLKIVDKNFTNIKVYNLKFANIMCSLNVKLSQF